MSRFIVPFQNFFAKASPDAVPIFGTAAALMCLSTIALGRRWVKSGSGIQANLYLMIVGDSSVARKSRGVVYAHDLLEEVEFQRVGPTDYTMEGLMKWMGDPLEGGEPKQKKNHVTILTEEFGTDLQRMTAYMPTFQSDFCRLYDGGSITKVRVGSAPLTVLKPRLSLFGACAYQFMEQHLKADDWTTGFLMRMLFIGPPDKWQAPQNIPALWLPTPQLEWDIAKSTLTTILAELTTPIVIGPPALPGLVAATKTHFGLDVSPAAVLLFEQAVAYFRMILPSLSFVHGIYVERFKVSILKVALLFQIDEDSTQPISDRAMQAALNFCGLCWDSFKITHRKTTAGEFSALIEMVVEELKKRRATNQKQGLNGAMPMRDLVHEFPNNRQVLKVLDYLLASDLVRRKKVSLGGQPVDVLELTS